MKWKTLNLHLQSENFFKSKFPLLKTFYLNFPHINCWIFISSLSKVWNVLIFFSSKYWFIHYEINNLSPKFSPYLKFKIFKSFKFSALCLALTVTLNKQLSKLLPCPQNALLSILSPGNIEFKKFLLSPLLLQVFILLLFKRKWGWFMGNLLEVREFQLQQRMKYNVHLQQYMNNTTPITKVLTSTLNLKN